MNRRVLWVSDNAMGIAQDGRMTELPSQRIAHYNQVSLQLEERHAWKSTGAGAQFMNRTNPYEGASQKSGTVTALYPLNASEMLYAVVFPQESGGIYRKDIGQPNGEEGIICSDRGLFVHDMHVRSGQAVVSVDGMRGQRHIGSMQPEAPDITYLTEGDTRDSAPYLSPDGKWVYYASAGNARNEDGALVQIGPMALLRMNLESGALEELLESQDMDYMRPKALADGTLYYIQRPYTGHVRQSNIKETLLAPVRFVVGFFRFFAMFGKLFSGSNAQQQPPGATGDVRTKQPDKPSVLLEGVRVQMDQALKANERLGDAHPGIVPASWELIRRTPDGTCTCVRRGVLDYDLCADGSIVCTNGRFLMHITQDGTQSVLSTTSMVLRVAAMD